MASERDVARAALTQLEYEREAACVPSVLADQPLPAYLAAAAEATALHSAAASAATAAAAGGGAPPTPGGASLSAAAAAQRRQQQQQQHHQPPPPLRPGEVVRPGGGAFNDVLGLTAAAADAGIVPVVMPGDRIPSTVPFPAPAEGESSEARRQRALHKQAEVLQGLHVGREYNAAAASAVQ